MDDKLTRLLEIGFKRAGSWNSDHGVIACELNELGGSRNVLYAFAAGGQLMYVGKTIQTLRNRMGGYRNPAPSQTTNLKNNAHIRQCLAEKMTVEVYVLPDNGLFHYGQFHINLAAGLEDSIIQQLNPPWNGGRKETSNQTLQPTEPA